MKTHSEPRYKDAALEALRYAFDHLRYGTQYHGGLLAWGGHLAYNATDEVFAGNPGGKGRIHELKCFFPHYTLMGRSDAVPAFTGAEPFFHAEYGTSTGRVYDSADIYGRMR